MRQCSSRLDGSEPREIDTPGISDAFSPSWFPDGRRLAFQCEAAFTNINICVINSDGTGMLRVKKVATGTSEVSPSWSPGGSRIAFAILAKGAGKIALMAPDGSGVTILTDGLVPTWSHDGKKRASRAARACSQSTLTALTLND